MPWYSEGVDAFALGPLPLTSITMTKARRPGAVESECFQCVAYTMEVPKLWNDTIEAHRREVREAILDTTWALASEHGPASVTMSQIAETVGIGRATLYKYFSDVEAILSAWHHRQISSHLEHLVEVRDKASDPGKRLQAVLEAYAHIYQRRVEHQRAHGTELGTLLHQNHQVAHAQQELHNLIRDVLTDAARAGGIRDDVTPDELASYCLHALTAASTLSSKAAVRRLITVTLDGIRPTR
jgi:AcrR family transcriptional regulator